MIIRTVYYSKRFLKDLKRLSPEIVAIAAKKEQLFRDNPLHGSLRLHELKGTLKGLWSISITGAYRIIFDRMDGGDIVFVSIGRHDIYKNL